MTNDCSEPVQSTDVGDEPKCFNCCGCGKALAPSEVIPLFAEGCCGFLPACRECVERDGARGPSRGPSRGL